MIARESNLDAVLERIRVNCLKPILCRPGGKTKLVKKLLPHIPPHETYIEPFFGTGALFFNKEPAKKEIINDLDRNVAWLHKEIKRKNNLTCDLKGDRNRFDRLMKKKSRNPCEHLYIIKNSFGCQGTSFGSKIKGKQNYDKQINRLKGVKIYNQDYKKILQKHNTKDSFAYLDPPYDGKCNYGKDLCVSPEEVAEAAKKFRGKVMISYNDTSRVRKAFKGFKIHTVKSRWAINNRISMKKQMKNELIIKNYKCKKTRNGKDCQKIKIK